MKHIGNPYEYFIYPPLAYITFGIFHLPISRLIDPNFIPNFWVDSLSIYSNSGLYLNLFLFKLPYLLLDVACGFYLAKIFEKEREQKYAFLLWMLNPVTLYATSMMGQFDIIPTFFAILALYYAKNKKHALAIVSLGIGASFKMFPMLFIFPAAFMFGKKFVDKLKYLILGFIPFLLTILPYITSPAFRQMALFSPKNQKMLFMGLNVSGAEVLYPFIILLTILFLHAFYAKVKFQLEDYFLAILLLMLSVTHFHPQWFLWATPYLIIYLIKKTLRTKIKQINFISFTFPNPIK